MAERSGFFDAHLREDGKYDRTYLADSFAKYFASFVGNGVYGGKSSELMVRQESTPTIIVFHCAKSPAMMCLRASPTSQR